MMHHHVLLLFITTFFQTSSACSLGTFFASDSYITCVSTAIYPAIPGTTYTPDTQRTTVVSTRGRVAALFVPPGFRCEVMLAPNASLGMSTTFSVNVVSSNMDPGTSLAFYLCSDATICSSIPVNGPIITTGSYIRFMKIVFQVTSNPTTPNSFLVSWDSLITVPCMNCNNLVITPPPSSTWLYNNGEGVGCQWKCAPGYYIPITGDMRAGTGVQSSYYFTTTTQPICAPCTACPSGYFTDPSTSGCWAYVDSNQGAYGAVINTKDSVCRQCSLVDCGAGFKSVCGQLTDNVCK